MAERAGWNTGPFDLRIWIFLVNKRKIQINVSERTLGDCQSDAGFHQRGMPRGEGHPAGPARPSPAARLESATPGMSDPGRSFELVSK